eukprot:scaffold5886_cov93-Cylindrotheca_fusiformis.AAC.3
MAANLAALRNYLSNTLQMPDAVRDSIVDVQGFQSLSDFLDFEDKDIHDLCVNIRRGSGATNPGIAIGMPQELRLCQVQFYVEYMGLVQRRADTAHATLVRLRELWLFRQRLESEKEAEPLEPPEKMEKQDEARKYIEDIDEYLLRTRNSKGVPLAYLTRTNVNAPAIADDPGYGSPSWDAELIRRVPHTGTDFDEDNKALWTVMRPYLAFKGHYLGDGTNKVIKNEAEATLAKTYYDGRKRHFSFESYAERITKAFDDLAEAGETVDESRKIRKLLNGIHHHDLGLTRAIIDATPNLSQSYDNTVQFLRTQVLSKNSAIQTMQRDSRQIGAFNSSGGRGRDGGRGRGRTGRGGAGRGRSGGRAGGRGGRSGGRGRGRVSRSGVQLTADYISPDDWGSLDRDERAYVLEQRGNRRNIGATVTFQDEVGNNNNGNGGRGGQQHNGNGGGRGIGALMTRRGGGANEGGGNQQD